VDYLEATLHELQMRSNAIYREHLALKYPHGRRPTDEPKATPKLP
jgi:hypothetical protein